METLGTLAGGIAHDINNILQTVFNNAFMAKEGLPEDHSLQANLDGILKAGRRAKDLVEQILTFSRRMEQQRVHIRPYSMLMEAMKLIEPSLPATIRLEQNIGDRYGVILADPTQIHQVIINLITNAVYAMEEKEGILKVSLDHAQINESNKPDIPGIITGHYSMLTVEDFGTGMDKQTMSRVFEPFFTTKDVGEGTGLGLSVVHGIVGEHGGGISVQSAPNKGTIFRVYFPRIEKRTIAPSETIPVALGGVENILYVDDDLQQIKDAKIILEKAGYHVDACVGSQEALDTFRQAPRLYDLVIADQMMPQISGVNLCRQLYEMNPNIKTMIVTGNVNKIPTDFKLNKGVNQILKKPFTSEELIDSIRKVLDN